MDVGRTRSRQQRQQHPQFELRHFRRLRASPCVSTRRDEIADCFSFPFLSPTELIAMRPRANRRPFIRTCIPPLRGLVRICVPTTVSRLAISPHSQRTPHSAPFGDGLAVRHCEKPLRRLVSTSRTRGRRSDATRRARGGVDGTNHTSLLN